MKMGGGKHFCAKINGTEENYLRYEIPQCTYCFSYMTLIVIAKTLEKMQIGYELIIAFIIYPFVYFLGMRRRYRTREDFDKYGKIYCGFVNIYIKMIRNIKDSCLDFSFSKVIVMDIRKNLKENK